MQGRCGGIDVIAVAIEQVGGDEGSAWIVEDCAHGGVEGFVKDRPGEFRMSGSKLESKICAKGFACDDDRAWRQMAGLREVSEGEVGVFEEASFAGVMKLALTVAAIVEREDVEAD